MLLEAEKKMIYYLASGIQKWEQDKTVVPEELIQGLHLLQKFVLENQNANPIEYYPNNVYDLLPFLQKPFEEWKLGDLDNLIDPQAAILDATGRLGDYVDQWLGEIESIESAEQDHVKQILMYCRQHQLQDQYVQIRLFIMDHPVVDYLSLQQLLMSIDSNLVELVLACYEEIAFDQAPIYLCPYCGWTLSHRKGDYYCAPPCHKKEDFRELDQSLSRQGTVQFRLRPGIHRYTLVPGLAEREIKQNLEKQGFKVEWYPDIDTYDLRIRHDEDVIDLDIKDYCHPRLLAEHLSKTDRSKYRNQALIVIPDYHEREYPNYTGRVKQYLRKMGIDNTPTIMLERHLYQSLRRH